MYEIIQSKIFEKWYRKLRSGETRDLVQGRLLRMRDGQLGDVKPVGRGVYEARIHAAGGIRLYYMRRGLVVIVLLVGGDKSTQRQDIEKALHIAQHWED